MDFRTILAIVIIGIIILLTPLYQKWLYRKAPPKLEEKPPPAETTSTEAVELRPPPVVRQGEEIGRSIVDEQQPGLKFVGGLCRCSLGVKTLVSEPSEEAASAQSTKD